MTTDPDPRIEAIARAELPMWTGSRFDELAGDRHREWRRKQAAVILAAADAVDPLRVRVDTTPEPPTPRAEWHRLHPFVRVDGQVNCGVCGDPRHKNYGQHSEVGAVTAPTEPEKP